KRKIQKKQSERKKFAFIRKLISFLFFAGLFFAAAFLAVFIYYARDLPRPERFTERPFIQSTKIYDRTGKVLLYDIYGEERRELIKLEEVPEHVKQAIIATEDANFYRHFGIDPKSVLRAILANLALRKAVQGGSTISQQLIRSSFLTLEKTFERKIKEVILTLELERRYSKDQILEFYLNQIPFGANAYGIEAASQIYFNKPISYISLEETAILAALIKSPGYLSPYGKHLDELLGRKDYVLNRMVKVGFITEEQAEEAKKKEIIFAKNIQLIKAPHFVIYVKDILEKKYGEGSLEEKGLKIYTTLNWDFQQEAEIFVRDGAKANEKYHAFNASLVAIDPKTGEILAMVGSKDFFAESFPKDCIPGKDCLFEPYPNIVIRGRQPGSAFKPFVYITAFKNGYDDKTIVIDEETNFGTPTNPYIPRNYDGRFRGPVTLREALAQSLNIPSIKVLRDFAGLKESIQTAKTFGINTLTRPASFYGLPLVLGGGETKLLEMTSAYGVFATGGLMVPPSAILKIEDSNGNIIGENHKTPKRVTSSYTANLISNILSDNEARTPVFGSRSKLYFPDHQVAVKTGTTQSFRDGWIIGYTPSLVVGVWTGNNDNSPILKEPGVMVAGPIWRNFMDKLLPLYPKEKFSEPIK
ncbi:MAG: penicillin-binding protein, partial [Candidatus Nealsonbacteria bacterium CG08_land_8_20_14_0_20_43_11]